MLRCALVLRFKSLPNSPPAIYDLCHRNTSLALAGCRAAEGDHGLTGQGLAAPRHGISRIETSCEIGHLKARFPALEASIPRISCRVGCWLGFQT